MQTHSLSEAEGLQLALRARGIEAIIFDEQAPGYMGFAGRIRVMVVNDADYDIAKEVERTLHPPPSPAIDHEIRAGWRIQRWGCAIVVVGFVVLTGTPVLAEDSPQFVLYAIYGLAAAIMVLGVTVIIFGPSLSRRKSRVP